MTDDLAFLDLLEVGARIRAGTTSSHAVTRAQLDRIMTLDPRLNSYITVTAELALEAALAADRDIADGNARGPLHGVPIAVKDICDIAGTPTTAGMPIRKDAVAHADATVVRRLKEAGAVILGKTNLTEGVYAEHVQPFGPPVNPWNAERWPGASSSGSGVAVAAGLCYGAIASETGGSIRLPAAVNGVTGLKPTWGRVSRHGVFELASSLDHVGCMARSATDAAAMLQAIAGADPADPTASRRAVPDFFAQAGRGARGVRVGIDRAWIRDRVDGVTVDTLLAALDLLAREGATLVDIDFPDPSRIIWDWFEVCGVETALAHEATYPARRQEYGPALSALLDIGHRMSALDHQRVIARRMKFSGCVDALFGDVDVLAMPVIAFPTPTIERMTQVDDEMISGLHRFTCSFTMSGHPAIVMPGGFTSDGMPIAIQFVGPLFGEASLVGVGSAYQAGTDWHRRRPGAPASAAGPAIHEEA